MDAEPELTVRVFANIHREHNDKTPSSTLISSFAMRARGQI